MPHVKWCSMTRIAVHGRLGAGPTPRETPERQRHGVARQGEDEATEWFSLAAFGRTAEDLLRHQKGNLLAVMGALHGRRFTGGNGQEREQWALTADAIVSARTVRPSGGRKAQRNGNAVRQHEAARRAQAPESHDDTDAFLAEVGSQQ